MIYVLDTNIISYMLNGDAEIRDCYRQESDKGHQFAIPPIVYYEIQQWLIARGIKRKTEMFALLISQMEQKDFDWSVWHKAAEIQAKLIRSGKKIGDADVLIAAYCILNDYTLVTNNTRHFEHVECLGYVNWKSE